MAIVPRKNKDGSITWQVKVKGAEGWLPTSSHADRVSAQLEESRLLDLKRKGGKSVTQDARTTSVDEFYSVWRVENRSEVSAGWQISQDQMYRDYVSPVLGSLTLACVGTPEVGRVLNRAQGMGLSAQTRKHVYSLMRKLFGDVVEYYEMLATSPVKPRFHRPRVIETKRTFLAPEQAFRLLDCARGHYLGPAIWLGLLSALRVSEIQALKGRALLPDLGQILICAAFNNKTSQMQDYPKQGDWAYVPMPPMLAAYLRALAPAADEFVAQSKRGGMLPYETFLQGLKRLCADAGLPTVTPHELRHSCTEIYMQAGATVEDVRRLLNHSNASTTMRYIHRTDASLSAVAGRVGNVVSFPNRFPIGKIEADSGSVLEGLRSKEVEGKRGIIRDGAVGGT